MNIDHCKVFMDSAFTIKTKTNLARKYFLPSYKIKECYKAEDICQKRKINNNYQSNHMSENMRRLNKSITDFN